MITEEQKEELRRMGRDEGILAVPAMAGRRPDNTTLTDEEWSLTWRVWKEPGSEINRFIDGQHPAGKAAHERWMKEGR
jgi:hypothetical protein